MGLTAKKLSGSYEPIGPCSEAYQKNRDPEISQSMGPLLENALHFITHVADLYIAS